MDIDAKITINITVKNVSEPHATDKVCKLLDEIKTQIHTLGVTMSGEAQEIKDILNAIDAQSDALAADVTEVKNDQQKLLDRLNNLPPNGVISATEAAALKAQAQAVLNKITPIETALNELGKTDPTAGSGDGGDASPV